MKLTKSRLLAIIREEAGRVLEAEVPALPPEVWQTSLTADIEDELNRLPADPTIRRGKYKTPVSDPAAAERLKDIVASGAVPGYALAKDTADILSHEDDNAATKAARLGYAGGLEALKKHPAMAIALGAYDAYQAAEDAPDLGDLAIQKLMRDPEGAKETIAQLPISTLNKIAQSLAPSEEEDIELPYEIADERLASAAEPYRTRRRKTGMAYRESLNKNTLTRWQKIIKS